MFGGLYLLYLDFFVFRHSHLTFPFFLSLFLLSLLYSNTSVLSIPFCINFNFIFLLSISFQIVCNYSNFLFVFSFPDQEEQQDSRSDRHEKQVGIDAADLLHLLPGIACRPTEEHQNRIPDQTSRNCEEQKWSHRHPGHTCRYGDQAAHNRNQPA